MDVKLTLEGTTRNPAVLPKYGERLAEDLLIKNHFLMRRIIKRVRLLCQVKNFKRSGMWDSLGSYSFSDIKFHKSRGRDPSKAYIEVRRRGSRPITQ